MKFTIKTFGCQMNVYESDRMKEILDVSGFEPTDDIKSGDILIINTCSVREKPRNKVISAIQNAKSLNPELKVVVTGCVAQLEGASLLDDGADLVIGPDNYDKLSDLVLKISESSPQSITERRRRNYEFLSALDISFSDDTGKSSFFVPVQKGCNNFCAYCTVPMARGPEISRPEAEILKEIDIFLKRGAKEIYLLGQNVNSYAGEGGFPALLRKIAVITDVKRIRFTTSHPKDLSDELLSVMAEYDNICPWLHLPLQAGSDDVLKAMGRGYTRADYLKIVEKALKLIPDISFTTDVIVGFPGETEENFMDTYNLVKEVGYEGMYSFKYSIRPGTRAAKMDGHLPENIKAERLTRLQKMHEAALPEIMKKYEGKVYPVLTEGASLRNVSEAKGRIPQNHVVNFSLPDGIFPHDLIGKIVNVRITEARTHTLYGTLL